MSRRPVEPPVAEAAPAKLNLYLHVLGKREDGLHLLDSLVAFAEVHDTIEAAPANDLSLEISGPFAQGLSAEPNNLVLRAAHALSAAAGIEPRARLRLIKRLPVASGIGGGSADAAAALRLLATLWRTGLEAQTMREVALSLGADVPVCLMGKAAYMGGIGEVIDPVETLPDTSVVLVNPAVPVPTGQVFAHPVCGRSPKDRLSSGMPQSVAELAGLLKTRTNDLAGAAVSIVPEVGDVVEALAEQSGCLLARMSGSGATCFGLFEDDTKAASAAKAIGRANPGWWVMPTRLVSDTAALIPGR